MTSARSQEPPASDIWRFVVVAGKLAVPGTVLASLAFYFGLRYTDDHYRQYGLDDASLGYSFTDYVIRSLNVLVAPARSVATVLVVVVAGHLVVRRLVQRLDRGRTGSAQRGLGRFLAACGLAGMIGFWLPGLPAASSSVTTVGWLASACLMIYGGYLASAGRHGANATLAGVPVGRRERQVTVGVVAVLLGVLVLHGAFEVVRSYARERAYDDARYIEAHPCQFPLVRIYSTTDLALDDRLEVAETRLGGSPADHTFRYDELRLFVQHGDRLVLWPRHRSPRAGMFILVESTTLRVEYEPQRLPSADAPCR